MQELVERSQQNDEMAFAQLYERYASSIYHYGLKLSRNEADAKDIVQDTFIQAQQSIQSLKEPKLFKVWLNKIAFSRATRLFSRNKTISFDPDDSAIIDQAVESRREMNPQAMVRFNSDKELLDHFIAQLPLEQQAALILMYYEHFTLQEIAQITEVPIGTVKSRLHTAKTKLNDMIEAYEKRNEIKITFKGEALLPAVIAYYSTNQSITSDHTLSEETGKKHTHDTKFTKTLFGKLVIGSCCLAVCAGIVISPLSSLFSSKNSDSNGNTFTKNELQLYPFPPIDYQNRTYNRADAVYYALIDFAHCESEMKKKTAAEFAEIRPLYEALKEYGGIYYDKLNENRWISLFEAFAY